jgi:site-specific DNA-methyltransferase (adenine-specific)
MFKYDWIWQKSKAQHFAQAPYRPMTNHEIISVFSRGGTAKNAKPRMVYYPQGLEDCDRVCRGKKGDHSAHRAKRSDQADYRQTKTGYPKTIQAFDNARKTVHPTQKPLDLMEFLVRSYTSEGDVVLDFAMGSGTTGLACQLATRCFIGIEKDSHYFSIAKKLLEHVPYT